MPSRLSRLVELIVLRAAIPLNEFSLLAGANDENKRNETKNDRDESFSLLPLFAVISTLISILYLLYFSSKNKNKNETTKITKNK